MQAHPKQHNSEKIINFCRDLSPRFSLPDDVGLMNPYTEPDTMMIASGFYRKYYNDYRSRIMLFGINPGRFGAGVTGIPFTDPIRLRDVCGIENDFEKKPELSSEFVYEVVKAYGGPKVFYGDFFVSAVCPLGFTRNGKNLNYYDDNDLLKAVEPFVVHTIRCQLEIFPSVGICGCIGMGQNYDYFMKLNKKENLFDIIVPLPHPRWVMQYRRKKKDRFIHQYIEELKEMREKQT